MRLGIDLDNTIVCYDKLFAELAQESGILPAHVPPTKQAIRDHLRASGQENRWTAMQGLAYGDRMSGASVFAGFEDFLNRCRAAGIEWWIISHRSQFPYAGPPVDLHDAARRWLYDRALISAADGQRALLELTCEAKLLRIAEQRCEVFIDDLAELLTHSSFPAGVRKILFDPADQNPDRPEYERVRAWSEIGTLLGV